HHFLKSNGFQNSFAYMNRGINADIFYAGPPTEFKDLPKPIALYVGRVSHEKNIKAFLDAPWAGSKVIVGSGPQLNELRTHYTDVVFMGYKSGMALAECYRSADIFVFPSKTDTFGMVNIEALACGLPVTAYPVQGPIDIITDITDGALDDDLAVAMAKALKVEGSAAKRAKKAAKTYSWENVAKDFLAAQ
ncbi:MAG: glycosyltransferase, partial [Pseudomonadota bacterium]